MNEEELKEFMKFSLADKEVHINQLIKVVSGIRLFNKECNLGGADICDCKCKSKIYNCLNAFHQYPVCIFNNFR